MKERSPSPAFWWLAAICSLLAIGIHFYLTRHHLDLQYGTYEGASICNINQTLDCDSVNTSSFSELFGAPLALWGAVANAAMLLLLLWTKTTSFRNAHLNRICFLFAGTIALASVIMIGISSFQLGTYCLFCILTYLCSFGLLLGVVKMIPLELSQVGNTLRYLLSRGEEGGISYLIFFAAIPVAVFIFNGMFRSRFGDDLSYIIQESKSYWQTNPYFDFDTSTGLHQKDSQQNYRMHIVEFADFGCSHCRAAAPSLNAFSKSRQDVQFTFMNFPLDGNCNPAITAPGHSCALAKGVFCANQQGKGWEFHDWLFEHQGSVTDVKQVASELKLEPRRFEECLESSATHEAIMKQASQGKSAGVNGTPTIFVNGKQLPRGQLMPILNEVYKSL